MRHYGLILLFLLLPHYAFAENDFFVNCFDSPEEATMALPSPMSLWGKIVCSKYGHIIGPNDGWIWSQPGGFAPIFIPAQMVREDPKETGNSVYFSEILFSQATDEEEKLANKFMAGFDRDPGRQNQVIYKLAVTNNSGQTQTLYFFDNPSDPHKWGIWCRNKCKEATHFMLLDMTIEPRHSNDDRAEKAKQQPEPYVNDRNAVVQNIAEKNGCDVKGNISVSTTEKGTEIYIVPCEGGLETYECEFTETTTLDAIGIPINRPSDENYVNPACWRI